MLDEVRVLAVSAIVDHCIDIGLFLLVAVVVLDFQLGVKLSKLLDPLLNLLPETLILLLTRLEDVELALDHRLAQILPLHVLQRHLTIELLVDVHLPFLL